VTIDNIDVDKTLSQVEVLLAQEKNISPALRALIEVLIMLVTLLTHRLNLNSRNSSKPPSSDPNRKKNIHAGSPRKPGGQKGHVGTTLKPVENPDEIKVINIDRRTIPAGRYRQVGVEARQVMEIDFSSFVTEYQAQILEDASGQRFVAEFPQGVSRPIQYGPRLKAQAVYLSQFQLIPYNRIQDYFADQLDIPLSAGSLVNFNQQAYVALDQYEDWVKDQLRHAPLLHADETGINVGGVRIWLHVTCSPLLTHFAPHQKRGREAMEDIGILPMFHGTLCHDHWKPYYTLDCIHALCIAHHLRELTHAFEQDEQQWAKEMQDWLLEAKAAVDEAGGALNKTQEGKYKKRYRAILAKAQIECPPPNEHRKKGQRGRIKRSKARNLLERLIQYEGDVLRFMESEGVPFTNNQGENDLRMTKVQQKISGCFRSMEGAQMFCRIRGYLSTCRKHNVSATEALFLLFQGQLPDFISLDGAE